MYKIFDEFLKENNFQLRTEIVDGNKFYAVDEDIDGNMITILVSVEQANIYHSVSVRLVRNIVSEKKQEYIKLANTTNLQYKNLCCTIGEDNHFDVSSYYIASEQTFDPKLLITIISSFIKVLKNGLLEEALRIKYR